MTASRHHRRLRRRALGRVSLVAALRGGWSCVALAGCGPALVNAPAAIPSEAAAHCTLRETPEDATVQAASSYAQGLQQDWDASGVVLVERKGEILLERAFGVASHESGAPMSVDRQFAIGSVTKEWTAWLVRDAAHAGKLSLDATLAQWQPSVPQWSRVTIRQLLEHRSGMIRTAEGVREAASPSEATEHCAQAPLAFEPGSSYAYSNCGYDVLSRVLELALGKPFPQLLEERLFRPRDMPDSGMRAGPRLATGYTREHGKTVPAAALHSAAGAGGGYSTARDLCQFLLAQREQEASELDPALRREQQSVHGQAGKTDGFQSFLVRDRATDTGIVYLTNQEGAPASRVLEDLQKLAAGQPAQPPHEELRRVIAGDPQREERLIGKFQLEIDPTQQLVIERRGAQLVFIDPGGQVSLLVWVAPRLLLPVPLDDRRSEVSSDAEITFPETDRPTPEIELHVLGGMRLKAARIP